MSRRIVRHPRLRSVFHAVFVCDAIVLPPLFYADGHPTLGGVLVLSGVLVFVVFVLRSGALATSWLGRQTVASLGHAVRFEFAKAMICGALALDALSGGFCLVDRLRLWQSDVTITALLTVAGLLTIGAGLFLTRSFAGFLMSSTQSPPRG